jgi:hypothetical protein
MLLARADEVIDLLDCSQPLVGTKRDDDVRSNVGYAG